MLTNSFNSGIILQFLSLTSGIPNTLPTGMNVYTSKTCLHNYMVIITGILQFVAFAAFPVLFHDTSIYKVNMYSLTPFSLRSTDGGDRGPCTPLSFPC